MEIVSVALSVLGLALFIVSFFIKGTNMKSILVLNSLGNFLMAASYICVWNLNGALSSVVGMAVGVVNAVFAMKGKKLPVWIIGVYAVAFVLVNVAAFTSWVDLFAIAATLAAVLSVCAATGKGYRLWSLANDLLWTAFDVLRGSYGPLLTHGTLIGFTLVGIFVHDVKRRGEVKTRE